MTDDAVQLDAGERAVLVAALRERWQRQRTPNAPRDVAVAEAMVFVAQLLERPPPVCV